MNDRHQRLLKLLSDIEQQIAEAESLTVEPGDRSGFDEVAALFVLLLIHDQIAVVGRVGHRVVTVVEALAALAVPVPHDADAPGR